MRATCHNAVRLLLVVGLAQGIVAPSAGPAIGTAMAAVTDYDIDRDGLEQGVEVALAIEQQVGMLEDEETLARLYRLGARIAYAAGDAETVYSFYVVDMPEPNAFAVPGGFIFFTQGMLDLELSDDAIGHLLGHEIAHVRNRHASRMGFWATITSVLQAAVVIGAAVAAGSAGGGRRIYEDEYGREYATSTGGEIMTSASVFSTVFRELFLRGYSRKLEMEADVEGSRLASAAGFPLEGGVELLEALHSRVYEDNAYSYWRTHPFFEDRLLGAEARLDNAVAEPDSLEIRKFRSATQSELTRLARKSKDEVGATLLYTNALRWGPDGDPDAAIQLELIRFRLGREEEKSPLDRRLGPVLVAIEKLAAQLHASDLPGPPAATRDHQGLVASVEKEREFVAGELEVVLPVYLALLDAPGAASNRHLQLFVDNYPEHPRVGEARLMMARRFIRDDDPDEAVPILQALVASDAPEPLVREGRRLLTSSAAIVNSLAACYEILDQPPDAATGELAERRMNELLTELDDLEDGARFVRRWPHTPYTEGVRQRVEKLAADEVRFGRVYEAGGKPQRALDIYNRVVLLAPDSQAAEAALRGIERIHQTGRG